MSLTDPSSSVPLNRMEITLFPDQQECFEKVVAAYSRCPQRGRALVVAPTGWGKTILFSTLIKWWFQRSDKPVMIIAHRDELLNQAIDKMHLIDSTAMIGKVGGGVHDYSAPITVASIDTISLPHQLEHVHRSDYGLVVCDECHHTPALKYQKVFQVLRQACMLGVTATPDRLDQQSIESLFGPPVFNMSIIEAIERKRLCDVRAIAIRTETDLDALHREKGDYNEKELEAAIDIPARNRRVVEAYLEHAVGKRAICFGVTVAHATNLATAFRTAGIAAAVVSGETPPHERARLYQAFRAGTLKVLTNVLVLTEGFDEPLVECVIMARPTQSRALFTQCIGRGLRLAPTKKECIVLDLTDNCLKHRLEPQNLSKALGRDIEPDESVLEALAREQEERDAAEKGTAIRRLKKTRTKDLAINLLARMNWQEQQDGSFFLEVGSSRHLITLVPSVVPDGYYNVWAQLAPGFRPQQWLKDAPLDWAQQYAERQVRLLEADENNVVLVDRRAGWRGLPVDPNSKQAYWLRKFAVPGWSEMTRGEASDILERHFAEREKERAKRKPGRTHRSV